MVARAQPSTCGAPGPLPDRMLHPSGLWGSSLGKFLFRFLLPPELGCGSSLPGTSLSLHTTGVHSNAPGPQLSSLAAGPQMQCRPSSVWWWVMGKYLAECLSPPSRMSLKSSLAHSQVQGSREVLGTVAFSPCKGLQGTFEVGLDGSSVLSPPHSGSHLGEGPGTVWVGCCYLPVP